MIDSLPFGYSIVIPVYNSADSMDILVERIFGAMEKLDADFELILVDDCSRDRSWVQIEKHAALESRIRGFRMFKNYGQHAALLAGILQARYACTITLDDDLQNPPEEIPKLVAELKPDVDLVYGRREAERQGFLRDIASVGMKRVVASVMGVSFGREITSFKLFRTDLRRAFKGCRNPQFFIDALLGWGTSRVVAVTVAHERRVIGKSNYSVTKLLRHTKNLLTGFSVLPLRLASVLGFAAMIFGLLLLAYVVASYFATGVLVPGFSFLACTLCLFSGVQLFCLGIVGEYIAVIHLGQMGKPLFVFRESTVGKGDVSAIGSECSE